MIKRRLQIILERHLKQFPAVALLGPRQVGKTTLAQNLANFTQGNAPPDYLDLENPIDLEKLQDAASYLRHRSDRLVIIDEVQRAPELFKILRGVIDERIRAGNSYGQFLLLGSASIELLRQTSETLAGRIAYLELQPLDYLEISTAKDNNPRIEDNLWIRGGFPRSYLAENESQSVSWRENFIKTYLERDIPMLGPRIPAETLRRFWTMLAHNQGGILNGSNIARSLAVDNKTVSRYLDLMVDLLLVRRLPPYFVNAGKRLIKSPKVYVRDSGLVHTLLRLDDFEQVISHPIAGMSWEGYVIENILRVVSDRTQASYYRTAAGAEIDLILELPGNRQWAIEIKRGHSPKFERGFRNALEDIQPDRAFIVYGGNDRYPKGEKVEVIGLEALLQEII